MKRRLWPAWLLAGALLGMVGGLLVGRVEGVGGVRTEAPPIDSERLAALREQNAQLKQLQRVDREALVTLRRQMVGLNARNADLERRLDLLRGVLLPQGRSPELGVGEVVLTRQGAEVAYRVLLVRVAFGDQAPALDGRVRLWALDEGTTDDASTGTLLAEQPLSLRRLQVLSGTAAVPARFAPHRLRVDLEPAGQAPRSFEFPWREAMATRATSPP